MISKITRFGRALGSESAKRLPYIIAIGVVLTFIWGFQSYQKLNQSVKIARDNTSAIKSVLDNQNKTLMSINDHAKQRTQQINDLQKHIDCITALFQYHNRAELIISDIENCQIDSSGNITTNAPPKSNQATAPKPQSQSPASPSSSSHSPQQPSQSQRPSQPPGLLKQIRNFLGL